MNFPTIKTNENFTFASVDNGTTHTVKKSKCRHYFISFTKKASGKRSAFKRVTLKFIKSLFNNIVKLITIKALKKIKSKPVQFKAVYSLVEKYGVKVTIGHLIKIEQGKFKEVVKALESAQNEAIQC